MSLRHCHWSLLAFVALFFGPANLAQAQQEQLQVLQNYHGLWDCQFTIHPTSAAEKAKQFSGVVEGKWILGNHFLQQTGQYQLDDNSQPFVIRTIMSVDQGNDRYQYDYYNSSGEIQRSFGSWDRVKRTMTSRFEDDGQGNVTTIVADFSTNDVEQWTIETKNRFGKTTLKISGTNRRKNKVEN